MDKGKKGIIAASAIGAAAVVVGMVYFLAPSLNFPSLVDCDDNDSTTIASPSGKPPKMLLVLLKGSEDASNAVGQYEADNTRAVQLLRKSHNINNEFCINLEHGQYELQVQASWFEKGGFGYRFEIRVA